MKDSKHHQELITDLTMEMQELTENVAKVSSTKLDISTPVNLPANPPGLGENMRQTFPGC